MFYKKKGIPEENEIVICTVKKILYHVVFVSIDDYKDLEGMVHISEISPGRIRNLRDFVKEGKRIVCKVLKIDQAKKQIDLSLRRVSPSQTRNKLTEIKQEDKSEKLLELTAKKLNMSLEDIYKEVGEKIIENEGTLTAGFYKVVKEDEDFIKNLITNKKVTEELTKIIKEKISVPEVKVSGILKLTSYSSEGINVIKKVIKSTLDFSKKKKYNAKIIYIGAPKYQLTITALDYKDAEKEMKILSEFAVSEIEKEKGIGEFNRNAK